MKKVIINENIINEDELHDDPYVISGEIVPIEEDVDKLDEGNGSLHVLPSIIF